MLATCPRRSPSVYHYLWTTHPTSFGTLKELVRVTALSRDVKSLEILPGPAGRSPVIGAQKDDLASEHCEHWLNGTADYSDDLLRGRSNREGCKASPELDVGVKRLSTADTKTGLSLQNQHENMKLRKLLVRHKFFAVQAY